MSLTTCTNNASAVTPAQGLINTAYAAIVTPELSSYLPANQLVIPVTGGLAIGIAQRGIRQVSGIIEMGTGVTAGAGTLYQLCLDGNWHAISAALTLAASTKYWFAIGPATSAGSFTITAGSPFLGLALVLTTALLGGNLTYLEIKGICELVDRPFDE